MSYIQCHAIVNGQELDKQLLIKTLTVTARYYPGSSINPLNSFNVLKTGGGFCESYLVSIQLASADEELCSKFYSAAKMMAIEFHFVHVCMSGILEEIQSRVSLNSHVRVHGHMSGMIKLATIAQ